MQWLLPNLSWSQARHLSKQGRTQACELLLLVLGSAGQHLNEAHNNIIRHQCACIHCLLCLHGSMSQGWASSQDGR